MLKFPHYRSRGPLNPVHLSATGEASDEAAGHLLPVSSFSRSDREAAAATGVWAEVQHLPAW